MDGGIVLIFGIKTKPLATLCTVQTASSGPEPNWFGLKCIDSVSGNRATNYNTN